MDGGFRPKRTLLLLISFFLLALLGLYSVSDPAQLPHNHALFGADFIAASVCHRIPSHTFFINGRPLPLCARCSGIYLGIVIVFLFALVFRRERHGAFPKRTALAGWLSLIGIMAFDGTNSLLHSISAIQLYEPNNSLRLITGMGAGLAIGVLAVVLFAQASWRHTIPQPPVGNWRDAACLLAAAFVVIFLILSNQTLILYVLGITSAVGVVAILATLYLVIVQLLLRRDGRASRWRALVPLGVCAVAITLVQIVALSTIRLNLTGSLAGF